MLLFALFDQNPIDIMFVFESLKSLRRTWLVLNGVKGGTHTLFTFTQKVGIVASKAGNPMDGFQILTDLKNCK